MFTSRSWSNRWHLDDAHLDHNCRICAEEFGESTWSVADHTARGSTMNRRFESGSGWKKTRVGLFEKMGEDRRAFGLSQAIIRVIILDDHFKGSFQVITSDVYSEIDEKKDDQAGHFGLRWLRKLEMALVRRSADRWIATGSDEITKLRNALSMGHTEQMKKVHWNSLFEFGKLNSEYWVRKTEFRLNLDLWPFKRLPNTSRSL